LPNYLGGLVPTF